MHLDAHESTWEMSNFHGSTLRSAFLGPGNSSVFRSEAVKAVGYHTKDSNVLFLGYRYGGISSS